ncbi:MAG: phosphatidate cytidylyltransferase [Lachnospiraceae bacterium]|nr:phosphatidate cytidylyltransferase [Lachnospiraceae bacterium]
MFRTRLLSGIVLVALALLLIITGGKVLLASTCAISLIGLMELYRVFDIHKKPVGILGYIFTVFYYLDLNFKFLPNLEILVIAFLILLLACFVLTFPKYHSRQIMAAFFGVFYVSIMLSFIYQTRMIPNGKYIVWLIFLCSWGCDTCAYCVGRLFGKHKMAPVLSPKKSVEGAIGGVAGAFLLTIIYSLIFRTQMQIGSREIIVLGIISAIGALISMIGDLAASAIKRNYDIKDYGRLIPGHGGILDRFDSVIITAPIIYFLAVYLV